jgi:trehalose/maltose hydrolase-like predicted phosphorylase
MIKATSKRFIEEEYRIEDEPLNSSLFTTGNGYIGVRGSFEEYGSLRIQGAYIRGVIDEIIEVMEPFPDNEYMKKYYINEDNLKEFEYQDSVVNNPDFLLIRISIDGETFYPWEGKIISWERYIEPQTARLVRNVRWESGKGDITDFEFERFSSYADDHVYCIKVKITPVNHSKKIEVLSGIDKRVKTGGQKITSVLNETVTGNMTYVHTLMGKKYGFETGITTVTNIFPEQVKWSGKSEDGLIYNIAAFDSEQGKEYTVEKCVYIISSREGDVSSPHPPQFGYDEFYKRHIDSYTKAFNMTDIRISGDEKADAGIRFANYHSLISASHTDSIHSVAAKGLTGERYNDFVWWDCEVYQLPIFIYTAPETAKKILMYRYRLLDKSKKNAREAGFKGAKYAFCSSVEGDERVWIYARHPFMQIHINADIAWGIIHYYTVTGDIEFLRDYGMEMLTELCEFWKSRVEWHNGRYEIRCVTGTDEHHPYVDNDAYTNYLVKFVLDKVTEYAKMFGMDNDYSDIADNMYLPIEKNGMIPQFDGYFDLSRSLEEAGGNNAVNFQMKSSGLYHKSQIIKQPDVMLLYSYLNINPENSDYAANWDYYEKMCESSSSLSFAPHSICSADNGRMLSAYNYLIETAYIDVYDIHKCGWQGVHSGCLVGAWYAVFRGIAGIVCREKHIEINPHMMPWWDKVEFSFMYHGAKLNVVMENGKYTLTTDSVDEIEVLFKGKTLSVTDGKPMVELSL